MTPDCDRTAQFLDFHIIVNLALLPRVVIPAPRTERARKHGGDPVKRRSEKNLWRGRAVARRQLKRNVTSAVARRQLKRQ